MSGKNEGSSKGTAFDEIVRYLVNKTILFLFSSRMQTRKRTMFIIPPKQQF